MATAIETALKGIRAKAERLREINNELTALESEKAALRGAPISLEDYKTLLPKLIELAASHGRNSVGVSTYLVFNQPLNGSVSESKKSWSAASYVAVLPDWIRVLHHSHAFPLLCWFDPERMRQKLESLLDEVAPNGWGNTEHPSIKQREERLAEIEVRQEALHAEKAPLDEAIQEVNDASNATGEAS